MEPGVLPHDPVRDGTIADFTYEEPFASLLGSHEGSMVDLGGRYSNSAQNLGAELHSLIGDRVTLLT